MKSIRIGTNDGKEFTYTTETYPFGIEYMYQGNYIIIITKRPDVRHFVYDLSEVAFVDIII